ncbi:ABC transporter permease [Myceligenerans pegani]|uniref:ABC transporter permease n=1 Tax=Myceligenerans pegani TaxID=2776917 RepID=A0ABR9N4K1_9MICO|nr:ABC transporter permease [Myceligenerans sp. TRM 65318]MBE1878201.1 ABC transporter permease [Myceligenerans sp. TRM 65318]MBE3020472.1 ABC transporter permease [Myceligenerans sp. TRM 65318]
MTGARISARGLLASEWTKLWSVRSLWLTLAAAFALTIGLCAYMIVDGEMLGSEEAQDIPFGWTAIYPVGMLVLVVFGVLGVTGEYSSGSIRTTMVAAPRRTGVLLAKAAVATGVAAVLGVCTSVLLHGLLQLAGTVPAARGVSLFDPDMFWGVLGGTLVLPYGALLGIVLGSLVRNAAAAICLYFGVFQMGPQILPAFLPDSLAGVLDYMPLAALDVLRAGGLTSEPYGAGTAAFVAAAWIGVLGGASWWLLRSRDV